MLTHPTLDLLHDLGLHGMAKSFRDMADNPESVALGHAEWLGILLEHESTLRQQKRFESRAKTAKLRHQAAIEDVDYRTPRGLDRSVFLNLSPVHPADRRTETELWSSFQSDYSRILGSVLDTIAAAMRVLPSLELDEVPRMAEFAYWGEAVGQALGWPEQSFRSAYARSRR